MSVSPFKVMNTSEPTVVPMRPTRERVALVYMPWGAITDPSLGLSLLKPHVELAGFGADVHYLNMRFAERFLGMETYEAIASQAFAEPEWYFSTALFGRDGLGELRNGWADLKADTGAAHIVEVLIKITGKEETCEKIASRHVPAFIEDCLTRVDWSQYMAVGFSTTFAQSLASLLLAKRLKDLYPNLKIIFGGANVDSEMGVEYINGFEWVDYVVHGEAERSLPVLLHNLAARHYETAVPGVSMRCNGLLQRGDENAPPVFDLNQSPLPDYSDYVGELSKSGFRNKIQLKLAYESSRGCWWGAKHHCTFCGLNATTMAFRQKDSALVYRELMQLSEAYNCLGFKATDNIIAMDYFKNLLPMLVERDLDLDLFYEVKANLTREQLKTLRAAGVRAIQPGIESFSSRILQLMRKGVSSIQNVQLLKWCKELDIAPGWNLLYGFPGETPQDYADLPHLCRLLSHLAAPGNFGSVIFERFSPYFFDREKFKLKLRPWSIYEYLFPVARVNPDKIAYYFDGEWEGCTADAATYMRPSLQALQAWQDYYKERRLFCCFEKGPSYVEVYDNRPRLANGHVVPRHTRLRGLTAKVFLFCQEIRAFRAIREMTGLAAGDQPGEQNLERILDRLVFQGLIFREGDRYLTLAVRGRLSEASGLHRSARKEKEFAAAAPNESHVGA